ncbi:MAG: hypothetical protein GC178_03440 [Flavobacteriales bacterium]|nr:hypothetical protein [Flavobacteriales bacterium]
MKFFEYSNYDYVGWNRPEHTIVRSKELGKQIFEQGYAVVEDFIEAGQRKELLNFFSENHSIEVLNGGFFVSIYSKNLEYRSKVHHYLLDQLSGKFDLLLHGHKYTCFNYAAKYRGEAGELFVHQDMAQVDESKYSQVGIWIPLVDVNIENGTLGILPYSHFSIPPHRSLYHQLPYSKIYDRVHSYMQPLNIKAGDLLLFDIRLLHNSFINLTDNPRISIAASAVPEKAPFCMAYRDERQPENKEYELLELEDDFYLTFKDFKSEKIGKPGRSTGIFVTIDEVFVLPEEFDLFCNYHNLKPTGADRYKKGMNTYPIQEPDHKEPIRKKDDPASEKFGFFQKLKQLIVR